MKKYILLLLAKLTHYIIPHKILLFNLRELYKFPMLRKYVNFLDPNTIRQLHGFNLSEKEIELRSKEWILTLNARDHIGFKSFILGRPFEMSVYQIAEKLKSLKGKLIIDIGANVGTASIPICSKYNYELIAVEASKENSILLSKNIIKNKIRAKLFLFALVEKANKKYLNLILNRGNTGANSFINYWSPQRTPKNKNSYEFVPTKTLDEIINEAKIHYEDVIVTKIDVEGMEEFVLKGGKSFLKNNSAPIILEYQNKYVQKSTGKNLNEVFKILKNFEYEIFSLNKKGNLEEFDKNLSYENIIAIKFSQKKIKGLLTN